MAIEWDTKELGTLSIVTLVLAFAFSYRFRGPFSFGGWFGNFLLILILVIISLAVHEIAHRYVAQRYLAKVSAKIFILGLLATAVITIITNGRVVYAAPWAVAIVSYYTLRPGREYSKWHLGPYESAKIALSGPLANLMFAVVAKLSLPTLGYVAEKLIFINVSMAVFNLLPISAIFPFVFAGFKPVGRTHTEGDFILFGSKPLWMFTFSFVFVAGLGLFYLGAATSVLLALLFAGLIWLLWHYFFVAWMKPKEPLPYRTWWEK